MRPALVMLFASIAASAAACGNAIGAEDGGCASISTTCAMPIPSFSEEIFPMIVSRRCSPCHFPGGIASEKPLDSFEHISDRRGAMLNQISACRMPPEDAGQLTESEKRDLVDWLVCRGPNN
jgi:hypothetical protein